MITGSHWVRRNRPVFRVAVGGFSLVEILVVLVILLIGILAILRLFPGGFLTIQRTGELTGGAALVAQQLDAQRNLASTADAIVGTAPNANGDPVADPTIGPDDIQDLTGIANGIAYYYSNINRLRSIIGETVRIPIATPNPATGSYGATYMLPLGPVYNRFTSDAGGFRDSLSVYGAPLERTEQSSAPTYDQRNPVPVLRGETQYAVDYDNLAIALPFRLIAGRPNPVRRFRISYEYYATLPNNTVGVKTAKGEILVPDVTDPDGDGGEPVWQAFFTAQYNPRPNDFLSLRRNSEDVSRNFTLLSNLPIQAPGGAPPAWSWSDDPYEYAWYSANEGNNNANVGVLLFNPRGRTANSQSSSGTQPFTARIDYTTFDNHIIREDRSVPNQAPYDIKLSLPFILVRGDLMEDQKIYEGMFRPGKNPTDVDDPSNASILIYNANTGAEVGRQQLNICEPDPNIGGPRFVLDQKTGTLRLNQTFVEANNLQNASLRFFYRAQKDWGMQVQKAVSRYVPAEAPNLLTYRNFYIGGSVAGVGLPTRIYFAPSEDGKSVVLGEYVVRTNLPAPNNGRRINSETYQIGNKNLSDIPGLPFVELRDQHPEAVAEQWQLSGEATGIAVNNVQGASLKSRVLWRGGTKTYADPNGGEPIVGTRWRKIDNDTILMQKPLR